MQKVYCFFMLLFAIAMASCKKSTIANNGDYNRSYQAWQDFKKSSGNSYRYTVITSSWTGNSTTTLITVRSGKVVERSVVARGYAGPGATTITVVDQFTENEAQLGSHQRGAALRTLDDIYKTAKEDWLLKRDKVTVYFEAKNNGMISSCGYVPDGCADDCFTGIDITIIEAI